MKKLILIALTFTSGIALANFECSPQTIQQWPHNPYVSVTEVGNNQYEVLIQRSYYGFSTDDSFVAQAQVRRDGRIELKDAANELTLLPEQKNGNQFLALLSSKEFGDQALNCISK